MSELPPNQPQPIQIDAELNAKPGERNYVVFNRAIEIRKQKGQDVYFTYNDKKMIVRADLKAVEYK